MLTSRASLLYETKAVLRGEVTGLPNLMRIRSSTWAGVMGFFIRRVIIMYYFNSVLLVNSSRKLGYENQGGVQNVELLFDKKLLLLVTSSQITRITHSGKGIIIAKTRHP